MHAFLSNGWLLLNKPTGITSNRALQQVRRALGKPKAGHAGTLDPLASGLLPLALGEACKVMHYFNASDKAYDFTVKWGSSTDTLDGEGQVTATSDMRPTAEQITAILPQFTGNLAQIPPQYSAIKQNGQPAYARVRKGETVILPPRDVTIHSLQLINHDPQQTQFSVVCSKGTYVRSLARDMAKALQAEGYISSLRRTQFGQFNLDQAVTFDQIINSLPSELQQAILPPQAVLDGIPACDVCDDAAWAIRHGQAWHINHADGLMQLHHAGSLLAIGQCADGLFRPKRVLAAPS